MPNSAVRPSSRPYSRLVSSDSGKGPRPRGGALHAVTPARMPECAPRARQSSPRVFEMMAIELADQVDHVRAGFAASTASGGSRSRIGRSPPRIKVPWWLAGKKPRAVGGRASLDAAARVRQNEERRQILVLGSQSVANPATPGSACPSGSSRCSSRKRPGGD